MANTMLAANGFAEDIHMEEGWASAAATASRHAGSPRCSTFSRHTPSCFTATTAA